jgi:hypothetical protein
MKYLYLALVVAALCAADRCGFKLKDVPERDHYRENLNPMTQP